MSWTWNALKTTELVVMKFGADIPAGMKCNNIGDQLSFHPAPSSTNQPVLIIKG